MATCPHPLYPHACPFPSICIEIFENTYYRPKICRVFQNFLLFSDYYIQLRVLSFTFPIPLSVTLYALVSQLCFATGLTL
jgi:hypothetical protein